MLSKNRTQNKIEIITLSMIVIQGIFFIAISYFHPFGDWDAWMIWNVKAIHLMDGNLNYYFNQSVNNLSHPGYPLLLPAILANLWTLTGSVSQANPALVAFLFCLSAIGILYVTVRKLSSFVAFLAVALLIVTPQFTLQGTSQYADIPLSVFTLAGCCMLFLNSGHCQRNVFKMVLSGILVGSGLLLKNEGVLIVVAFAVSYLVMTILRKWSLKNFLFIGAGILPFAVALIYYKMHVPSQDHLQAIRWNLDLLNHIATNAPLTISYYFKNALRFWEPIALVFLFYVIFKPKIKINETSVFLFLMIGIILSGYTSIYLIVDNPEFLLSTSSKRLIMHIYPILILALVNLVKDFDNFLFFPQPQTPTGTISNTFPSGSLK
jgi:4-amino-4-deoxy-L-arabinose transferase-like glycosyltransferase